MPIKTDNPFEKRLNVSGSRIPGPVRNAAIFVTDALELSWASAQAIFEEKATPELALAIYDRITELISSSGVERDSEDEET